MIAHLLTLIILIFGCKSLYPPRYPASITRAYSVIITVLVYDPWIKLLKYIYQASQAYHRYYCYFLADSKFSKIEHFKCLYEMCTSHTKVIYYNSFDSIIKIKVMITLDNPKFRQLRTNGICQLEIRRARQGLNNLFFTFLMR